MPDPIPPVPVVTATVDPPPPPITAPVIVTVAANRAPSSLTTMSAVGHPDVIIKVIQPVMIIAVRATRVFLQTLSGLVTAGIVAPKALPASDFLHLVYFCASLSLAPAGMCVLQNTIELLTQIDQKYPTLSA